MEITDPCARPLGYDSGWYDNGPGSENFKRKIREGKEPLKPILFDYYRRFRNLMFIIEKELAKYEVVALDDDQKINISITGKTAKKICKLMADTS